MGLFKWWDWRLRWAGEKSCINLPWCVRDIIFVLLSRVLSDFCLNLQSTYLVHLGQNSWCINVPQFTLGSLLLILSNSWQWHKVTAAQGFLNLAKLALKLGILAHGHMRCNTLEINNNNLHIHSTFCRFILPRKRWRQSMTRHEPTTPWDHLPIHCVSDFLRTATSLG